MLMMKNNYVQNQMPYKLNGKCSKTVFSQRWDKTVAICSLRDLFLAICANVPLLVVLVF